MFPLTIITAPESFITLISGPSTADLLSPMCSHPAVDNNPFCCSYIIIVTLNILPFLL